ncbi:MAG: hypothetical protein R3F17_07220 [Planctomycetota bacterium]
MEQELANWSGDLTSDGLVLGDESVPFAGHCLVSLWRNPRNNEQVIGLLTVDPVEAAPGLQTKLPHYGKYSYLAFEGAEPTNTVKGQWPTSQSPLFRDLRPAGAEPLAALAHEERQPLATLPPEFSQARMMRRAVARRSGAPGPGPRQRRPRRKCRVHRRGHGRDRPRTRGRQRHLVPGFSSWPKALAASPPPPATWSASCAAPRGLSNRSANCALRPPGMGWPDVHGGREHPAPRRG